MPLERELSLRAWEFLFRWRFESAQWAEVQDRLATLLLAETE